MRRPFCPGNVLQPGQILFEHIPIKKQQRRKSLILGGGSHFSVDRQMRKDYLSVQRVYMTDSRVCNPTVSYLIRSWTGTSAPMGIVHRICPDRVAGNRVGILSQRT